MHRSTLATLLCFPSFGVKIADGTPGCNVTSRTGTGTGTVPGGIPSCTSRVTLGLASPRARACDARTLCSICRLPCHYRMQTSSTASIMLMQLVMIVAIDEPHPRMAINQHLSPNDPILAGEADACISNEDSIQLNFSQVLCRWSDGRWRCPV